MCVPVRGHRGELGDRRSRRVDLEASRDATGPERLPGSREAVRRASSRSDNSLTEQSASDRSPAHAGPPTARGRPRSEASFEKVIRTSTLSTTAASHRAQRGGRESNSSWRRRDPPKTSQLELVTAGQSAISELILPTCRALLRRRRGQRNGLFAEQEGRRARRSVAAGAQEPGDQITQRWIRVTEDGGRRAYA